MLLTIQVIPGNLVSAWRQALEHCSQEEVSMAYRFQVNQHTCINCGICMDLCPVRCLDMTRPSGEGEGAHGEEVLSPIPGEFSSRAWMMLTPVQVAACIGCQVCAQECPTNAITIESLVKEVAYAKRGSISYLPPEAGWQPLDAYTRANPAEPGETPWGEGRAWHVAERQATWQSWRTWLGERKEDLRAPCQAICGRVCTAPCEEVCRRGEFDLPIAIRDLKRFATDHGTPGKRVIPLPKQVYAERVAIVGAGPTGLSAAYYLARRGYSVIVFDAMPVPGGMMAIGIPEYRLPRAELSRDIDAMRELGVDIRLNTAIGRDLSLDELSRDYDAVLLAVGAQRSQRLGIHGELVWEGVIPATSFLKDFNLNPQTKLSGVVAVVGGGSTAMDAARSALRAGADKVYVLYRRTRMEMPAQIEEVRAALEEGIELEELVAPVQLLGSEGKLRGVRCQRMTLSEPDEKGRRKPVPVLGTEFDLPIDIVLVAIGEAPDPSFLPEGTSVGVAPWGGLLINPVTLATGAPGVFAAGDVTYGPRSIIHAAAHGRKAAHSIHAYLRKLSPDQVTEMPEDEFQTASTLPPDGRITVDLRPTAREVMPLRSGAAARTRSVEFALGLTEEQARREASRCLRCDLAYLCPTVHVISADMVVEASASRS